MPDQSSRRPAREYAHERAIRDRYALGISDLRPGERLLDVEHAEAGSSIRSDMRTIDVDGVLRIWEFKIRGSYQGLGQVLTYVASARRAARFATPVRGVLAAFAFHPEVVAAVEMLNLGIELVLIPETLRRAGGLLAPTGSVAAPVIPVIHTAKD
jgi:hypothetical protein